MSAEAKFNGALGSTIYRPELSSGCGICRDHDHWACRGASAGFTSHELLSHVQRVMDQLGHGDESKHDVMWLAADVSWIGKTAICPFAETTFMSKEYLKCSANRDVSPYPVASS